MHAFRTFQAIVVWSLGCWIYGDYDWFRREILQILIGEPFLWVHQFQRYAVGRILLLHRSCIGRSAMLIINQHGLIIQFHVYVFWYFCIIYNPGHAASHNDDPISWTEKYFHASSGYPADYKHTTWFNVDNDSAKKHPLQVTQGEYWGHKNYQRVSPYYFNTITNSTFFFARDIFILILAMIR